MATPEPTAEVLSEISISGTLSTYLNGQWHRPEGGHQTASVNPATGETLTHIEDASAEQIDAAVAHARDAFGAWAGMSADARSQILWRVAQLIDDNVETLARLETQDQGQPLAMARTVNVRGAAAHFRYFAGWTTKLDGRTPSVSRDDAIAFTERIPVGVCGLITPWNFPLLIAAWKLAPALACGNTVVFKPAEQTSITAVYLMTLLEQAGVPSGVVNLVTGGPRVGKALVGHPGVDKISFTGSTAVGQSIVRASAESLKRVTLELGGKAPSIVCADADMDRAVAGNLASATLNAGQVCGALTRFYVARPMYDEFVSRISSAAEMLRLGSGEDSRTQMGPLTTHEHRDGIARTVAGAIARGATVRAGGDAPKGTDFASGAYYRPTVLTDLDPEDPCMTEEIFGPVIPIVPFETYDEAVELANRSAYGLAASVWSRDVDAAVRLSSELNVGAVRVNTVAGLDPASPWGGTRRSGWGREMGEEALDAYTEVRTTWLPRDEKAAQRAVEGTR